MNQTLIPIWQLAPGSVTCLACGQATASVELSLTTDDTVSICAFCTDCLSGALELATGFRVRRMIYQMTMQRRAALSYKAEMEAFKRAHPGPDKKAGRPPKQLL